MNRFQSFKLKIWSVKFNSSSKDNHPHIFLMFFEEKFSISQKRDVMVESITSQSKWGRRGKQQQVIGHRWHSLPLHCLTPTRPVLTNRIVRLQRQIQTDQLDHVFTVAVILTEEKTRKMVRFTNYEARGERICWGGEAF